MSEAPFRHGQLSYVQIPATDTSVSGAFYREVFGWDVRGDGGDHVGFTDAAGTMIGAWVTGRAIADPGVLPYISVDGVEAALERITAHGGEVVRQPYDEGDLIVATFRDPAGNVIGIWQMG